MKLKFIPNLPYTYRDHVRFGVEYFLDKGYDVEVLDIHKILVPGYKEKVDIDYWTFKFHYELNTKKDLLDCIQNLESTDFIFFYIAGKEAELLLSMMRKSTQAKFITYIGGSIPITTEPCGIIERSKSWINQHIRPVFRRKIFATDYYVSGSPKDEKVFSYLIDKNTKVLKSHSRDYNLCLDANDYFYEKPYCVFLDTDVIDASDYILMGKDVPLNQEEYITKIVSFFYWIEEMFQVEVIIAAHPKSRIYFKRNSISGIKIVHGKSVQLVKNAKFVLNEGTTSIAYAIFFSKPILFFTLREIAFFKHTCAFAKALKKAVIEIDTLSNVTRKKIDEELKNKDNYEEYKKQYLTYNDKHISTYDMLHNFFKSYEKELK